MPCYISRRDQTLITNVIKIGQRWAGADKGYEDCKSTPCIPLSQCLISCSYAQVDPTNY